MWMTRPALAAALTLALGAPAFAKPIEIATLGRAPLIGQSTNASELKYNVKTHETVVRSAAYKLGLTKDQYEQFRLALAVGKPNWVTIPRHLDAMSWASGGQVHVLHDVIIPANQKGVEVDLHSGDKIISLFLPARCGNLSVIRRNVPHVAAARIAPPPAPAVAAAPPPAPEVAVAPPPAPIIAPAPVVAPIVAPASHAALGLLPLAALVPFLFHGGGGGGGSVVTPFVGGNTGGGGGGGGTIISPPPCPPGTDP